MYLRFQKISNYCPLCAPKPLIYTFSFFLIVPVKTKQWKQHGRQLSWTPFCHPNIKKCAIQTELKICFIFFLFVLNKTVKYNMGYIAIASLKKITLFATNAFHENIILCQKLTKIWQNILLKSYLYTCKQNINNWFIQFSLHIKQMW